VTCSCATAAAAPPRQRRRAALVLPLRFAPEGAEADDSEEQMPVSRSGCCGAERRGAEASMVGAAAAARYGRAERLRDSFAGLEGYSFCPRA